MHFSSDNSAAVHPAVMDEIIASNNGYAGAYGSDEITRKAIKAIQSFFETDCDVYFVATGTAANALSLQICVHPHNSILCHSEAHINTSECGAPELYTGGSRLIGLTGDEFGKITPEAVAAELKRFVPGSCHDFQPAALSITQLTEVGTCYTLLELKALSNLAHEHGLKFHMDGARFCNALLNMGCSAAEMTHRSGVDVLSFGATKCGAFAAEAVVVFNKALSQELIYQRKRAGQLFSKHRFFSAQFFGFLQNNLWHELASHANLFARKLEKELSRLGYQLAYPVEGNLVFARFPKALIRYLYGCGAHFYAWPTHDQLQVDEGDGELTCRLATSFMTKDSDIEDFMTAVKKFRKTG